MADCVLSDGREVTFDLNQMTVDEWRAFFDKITPEGEDSPIESCAGFEPGSIRKMGIDNWKAITAAFYKRMTTPHTDPKN